MFITSSRVTPPAQLRIKTRCPSPGTAQIAVEGEIDLATTEELQAGVLRVLTTPPPQRIEIDLAGVTFMGCGGLTVLVLVAQAAARAGCHLQITNPQPFVRGILEMTGLLGCLTLPRGAQAGRSPALGR